MHVWFLSHNFPPESNALATRTYEHAREWAREGHSFDIVTDVPHFPEGRVYHPFRNLFQRETVDGISVYRVPVYPAENQRRIRRTLSFISFMLSCILFSPFIKKKPTLVVASSPQIFTAFGGYILSRLFRVPFVMEVRDLWPQSISAVGAMKKSFLLNTVDYLVQHLYQHASAIVALTMSFKAEIVAQGVDEKKIFYVPNGISEDYLESSLPAQDLNDLRLEHGLADKFVVSYLGTIGMAHGLDTIIQAAQLTTDPRVQFLIIGEGAHRRELAARLSELNLANITLLPKQPRSTIRSFLELSDVSLVLLKDLPLFETVIPSKLLEAMGCGKPVILGVRGESREILKLAQGGIAIPPEDSQALADAVAQLSADSALRQNLGSAAKAYTLANFNRKALARDFWQILQRISH